MSMSLHRQKRHLITRSLRYRRQHRLGRFVMAVAWTVVAVCSCAACLLAGGGLGSALVLGDFCDVVGGDEGAGDIRVHNG